MQRTLATPRRGWRTIGRAGLMPAAALLVHQLRYWLTYGPKATRELAEQGHSYLHSLTPWIVGALAVTLGAFLVRLGRAARGGRPAAAARPRALRVLWPAATAALVALYAAQESIEGWLVDGHPAGLQGIFGHGGWWAIPAALVVGALVALALRGAAAALRLVARWPVRSGVRRRPLRTVAVPRSAKARPRQAPLARAAAGRAPPGARALAVA